MATPSRMSSFRPSKSSFAASARAGRALSTAARPADGRLWPCRSSIPAITTAHLLPVPIPSTSTPSLGRVNTNRVIIDSMEITEKQFEKIRDSLPIQRGNVKLQNLTVVNAILFVAEHGCKWRGLPPRFGNWHSVYTRMNRWAKKGVLDRVFEKLQTEQIVRIKI